MNLSLVSVVCLLGTLQVNAIIEVPNSVVSASSPSFNWAVFLSAQRPLETFKVLMKTELEIIPDWEKVYWFRSSHGTENGEFVFFMVLHQNSFSFKLFKQANVLGSFLFVFKVLFVSRVLFYQINEMKEGYTDIRLRIASLAIYFDYLYEINSGYCVLWRN